MLISYEVFKWFKSTVSVTDLELGGKYFYSQPHRWVNQSRGSGTLLLQWWAQ